jgi:tRNA nucleotidyltransferase/poly(A) polymerase
MPGSPITSRPDDLEKMIARHRRENQKYTQAQLELEKEVIKQIKAEDRRDELKAIRKAKEEERLRQSVERRAAQREAWRKQKERQAIQKSNELFQEWQSKLVRKEIDPDKLKRAANIVTVITGLQPIEPRTWQRPPAEYSNPQWRDLYGW